MIQPRIKPFILQSYYLNKQMYKRKGKGKEKKKGIKVPQLIYAFRKDRYF